MRRNALTASMTVFLIFFGVALLDALKYGHWISALFWLAIGAAFFVLGRQRRQPRTG